MSAVAKVEQQASPVVAADDAMVAMIERASRDPNVDMDKMERLVLMRERMLAGRKEEAFNEAMARAQAEMRPVAADSNNPSTKSKYASYFALDNAVRPIYTKHGFGLSFDTEDGAPPDHTRVVCYVTCAGHCRKYHWDAPSDGKGAKGGDVMTKTHAGGAAMTYAQRYLLKMIFNMAIGEDKDGNESAETITPEQVTELRDLIEEVGADVQRTCTIFRIDGLALLPAKRFEEAKARLRKFGEQNKGTK